MKHNKVTYENRYRDKIVFTEYKNKVTMKGFNADWLRVGYPNDYTNAYKTYCDDVEKPMSLEQFQNDVHEYRSRKEFPNWENPLKKYQPLVKSDMSKYSMVDPSGGPYITLGSDLKYFFGDGIKRIVKEIQFGKNGNGTIIFLIQR
jgi:hypothetical protein